MDENQSVRPLKGVQHAPLPVHRQKSISLVAGFGFYLVVVALLAFIATVGYKNEISSSKDSVRFQAALFAEETRIALDRIDKLLDIMEVALFSRVYSSEYSPLIDLVQKRSEGLGFIRSLVLMAPNGQILLHLGRPDSVNFPLFGNVPHYDITPQLTAPKRTRRDGPADYFALYRPVLNQRGEIVNYVAATVDLMGFVNEMGIADIDPSLRLSLYLNDGTLFARSLDTTKHAGRRQNEFSKIFGNAMTGEGVSLSSLDNQDYVFAFSRVKGFPLTALASRQYASILRPWKMELFIIGLIAILVLIVNAMVLRLLSRNRKVIEESQQKLLEQAYTDQLTGLLNRRAFFAEAEKRVAEATRYGRALSLLVLDIDHFKVVNDTYGHEAGDQALKDVASVMATMSRESDILSRYGGEEFTLMLPQTNLKGAVATAEKLRKKIEAVDVHFGNQRFQVTISIGAAELRPNDTVRTLFQRGDAMLYRAKNTGRNRVAHKAD